MATTPAAPAVTATSTPPVVKTRAQLESEGLTYLGPSDFKKANAAGLKPILNGKNYYLPKGVSLPGAGSGIVHGGPDAVINGPQQSDFAARQAETDIQVRTRLQDTFNFLGFNPQDVLGGAPQAPSLAQLYQQLRTENGVSDLETSLTNLKSDEAAIRDRAKQRSDYEAGKPVPMGVISGKQSEIQKQAAVELDQNLRAQQVVTDQLNTKYSTISTIVQLTGTDYTNAQAAYDSRFSHAMQAIDLVRGVQKDVIDEKNQIQDTARANLQIIYNSILDGNVDFKALDPTTKANITKMEASAGLPIGFVARIHSTKPNQEIVATNTRVDPNGNKYADVMLRDKNGKITVQHTLLGKEKATGGGGGSAKETQASKLASYTSDLNGYSKNVVTSRNPANDSEITREELIDILVEDHKGVKSRDQITKDVFASYPDNFDKNFAN